MIAKRPQRAAHEVGAQARLHADDAGRQLPERLSKPKAPDLAAEGDLPALAKANDVEDVLADIDADGGQGRDGMLCRG
jgi:hypothetical protein